MAIFHFSLYRGQNEVIEVNASNFDLVDPNDVKNDLKSRLSGLLRQNSELTYKELAKSLSVSEATVKRTISKMQNEGKVIREGSNRKGKWILKEL